MKPLKQYFPYVLPLLILFSLSFAVHEFDFVANLFTNNISGFYLSLAVLFIVGYGINRLAPKTTVPVYVWAILFGIALQLPLSSLANNREVFTVIINLITAFILFASAIEIPVKNFKKYFIPIASLSLLGTVLTILLFAASLSTLTALFGLKISALALLVLAAILSSVDPTTVIPALEDLHLKRPFIKDIAISESAANDVVGTILTRFFLIAALGTATATTVFSVGQGFSLLLTKGVLGNFALEIVWGTIIGLLGTWILKTWGESVGKRHWSDTALFFAVPVFCFALGSIAGGSGFFAPFIAGLLFELDSKTKKVQIVFEDIVNRFIKPVVFILLGVLVPIGMLVNTIGIGAVASIIFMFFIRPIVVYTSLLPWMISKKATINWREALLLSFVRETGAIPAVLILYAFAVGVLGIEVIFGIGVWVIIYTLVIEPPLTPVLAEYLKITKD